MGGLDYQGKTYQADYYAAFEGGKVRGVLAHSWSENVLVFCPDLFHVSHLLKALGGRLRDKPRSVGSILGPKAQVDTVRKEGGIGDDNLRNPEGREEYLFSINLCGDNKINDFVNPHQLVRRAIPADADTLTQWRYDFNVTEHGDAPNEETFTNARNEVIRRTAEGTLFVLEDRGEVVSFCGVGGFLPDWKMVGPVWTPPTRRGRGYARAVVAGGLRAARDEGAERSVLFSLSPVAIRAYEELGYKKIGDWRIDNLKNPIQSIPALS